MKKISGLDVISSIDRQARLELEADISKDLDTVGENTPPSKNDHGILVMDSGIKLHPLLKDAVDRSGGMVGLRDKNIRDDRAHTSCNAVPSAAPAG